MICKKQPYQTQKIAELAMKDLLEKGHNIKRCYYCFKCFKYHLTSKEFPWGEKLTPTALERLEKMLFKFKSKIIKEYEEERQKKNIDYGDIPYD